MAQYKMVAATHNPGKLAELRRILAPCGVELMPLPEQAAKVLAATEENGDTFAENALIKARAVFGACGIATLADDSGLCIDALDGRPGVYSARYLGENTPYAEKNALVLEQLRDVPPQARTARFECAVAVVCAHTEQVFLGVCPGSIGQQARGEGGFGYDPIFYVQGGSYAELSAEQKDAVSHRARALRAMCAQLPALLSSQ